MNGAIEKHLGVQADICDVCGVSLKGASSVVSEEFMGTVVTFCSKRCRDTFLKEPEKYEFQDESEEAE